MDENSTSVSAVPRFGTISKRDEIVVFWIVRDSACAECGEELGTGCFLRMETERPLCLRCADLDHRQQECLSDTEARRLARERAAERRHSYDAEYLATFASPVGDLFPGWPIAEPGAIA